MVDGVISFKKVLQSSDSEPILEMPSVLEAVEASVSLEARAVVLNQLCNNKAIEDDIEELKKENAETLSNITAAEKEYLETVNSGAFVEKMEKAIVALESLDVKEKKIDEKKMKIKTLQARNEDTKKSLISYDSDLAEEKIAELTKKRDELKQKLAKLVELSNNRQFEYQRELQEANSNGTNFQRTNDDGYDSAEAETNSMETI
ncbi:Oidioi.mRNA.OKI2018_I69.chr1.g3417.t1.cds [Oikopleura dioica]|uniref:Oidioi.mRNA.OKI2018_I69.chr1.g3417.t1.cds n=1 Tax=Oikopleura dioica TaxID=34765 RepID=A0ABN7SU13_OIKDI|nr:Oidioi.mRNA.OKI2018_I69.chr1.g3417.t1.cds [Oikopleura dioica]